MIPESSVQEASIEKTGCGEDPCTLGDMKELAAPSKGVKLWLCFLARVQFQSKDNFAHSALGRRHVSFNGPKVTGESANAITCAAAPSHSAAETITDKQATPKWRPLREENTGALARL